MVQNGTNGDNGYNAATIYLYRRSSGTATKPTSNSWYKFSTDVLSSTDGGSAIANLNGWTRTIPTGTDPL